MKPFFTDKGMNEDKIILVDTMKSYQKPNKCLNLWITFFADVIMSLNIPQHEDPTINTNGIDDLVSRAIKKYINHPRIKLIKTNN